MPLLPGLGSRLSLALSRGPNSHLSFGFLSPTSSPPVSPCTTQQFVTPNAMVYVNVSLDL